MLYVIRNIRSSYLNRIVLFLLTIFLATEVCEAALAVTGQDSTKILMKEYKKKGKYYYLRNDINNAEYYYQKYADIGGNDLKCIYRLAGLYFLTRDYSKSLKLYDTIVSQSPGKYLKSWYYRGVLLMNLQRYDEAITSFNRFKTNYRGVKDKEELRKMSLNYLESANWAKLHVDSVQNITITNIGTSVNKTHIEFSPFPIGDNQLLYGTLNEDTTKLNGNVRELYIAERSSTQWKSLGPVKGPVNMKGIHTGNGAISPDGHRLYFTRCSLNWQNKMICAIYVSQKIEDQWQEPDKLPFPVNDENYTSTQPSIGTNIRNGSEILYFVSDRPGGSGGMDIWYTEFDKTSGQFKEPKSLGRGVNTLGNECCPFYDNNNRTLYFSSTGYNGFGGYDIYNTIGSGRKWTDIQHLPQPVNTSYDDTYFVPIGGLNEGYFTSNRPGSNKLQTGSCCDDIFYFRYNECTRINVKGKVVNLTNYDLYDDLNSKYHLNLTYPVDKAPLSGIPVQLYMKINGGKDEILVSSQNTLDDGSYQFNVDIGKDYVLSVKNYGYFDKRIPLLLKESDCSDTINAGITQLSYLPEITIRFNIYYEHDKSRLTDEARRTIDSTLLSVFDLFPNAIIEIGSHTDNTGSDSYNLKLSQRRSESVTDYLIRKGISPERLIAKGYGESQPITPNQNADGTDSPEGRQLNRRTELKIVGELNTFYLDE